MACMQLWPTKFRVKEGSSEHLMVSAGLLCPLELVTGRLPQAAAAGAPSETWKLGNSAVLKSFLDTRFMSYLTDVML